MEGSNFLAKVGAWPRSARDYVSELQMEMRRVTWPTWKQVRSTTIVVIVAVFAFAVYFRIVDYVVGNSIAKVFDTFTK
jgi:preprotein translocase subunit SecE